MEEGLIDDVIVEIMKMLDPLSLILFGMTSKANEKRRRRPATRFHFWRTLPLALLRGRCRIYIGALLEAYATPQQYVWAETHWRDIVDFPKTNLTCLLARNYALEAFLLKQRQFVSVPLADLLRAGEEYMDVWEHFIATRSVPVEKFDFTIACEKPATLKWLQDRDPFGGYPNYTGARSLIERLRHQQKRQELGLIHYRPLVVSIPK
jgi:hypothetical protein